MCAFPKPQSPNPKPYNCALLMYAGPSHSSPAVQLSTSSIRRPDSLTTVARSTSTLVLGDFPDKQEDPSTSVRRLVFEGYYGMPCQDKQWPALEDVIRAQEASSMMSWMQDALPRHPKQGVVSMDDCRGDLLLDPQGLPWNLQLINAAWVRVGSFQALKDKSTTMTEAVHNQAEQMIHKLRQQLDNGDLTEDLLHRRATATEQWRSKKTTEIQAHLDRAEMAALVAIDKAVDCFFGLWGLFRDFGHMGQIPVNEHMDEQLFMNELEESMAKFSLDEAWVLWMRAKYLNYNPKLHTVEPAEIRLTCNP